MKPRNQFCKTAQILFLLAGSSVLAFWSEPVLLSELNNINPPICATTPCIASDSMSIFYTRETTLGVFASRTIFEAWRDDLDSPFVYSRPLTELRHSNYISDPWISKDRFRLYYVEIEYSSVLNRWVRVLKMATRKDFSSNWVIFRSYLGLCTEPQGNVCSQISLTEDERTIVWYSYDTEGLAPSRVMSASRPSILHDFSNIHPVDELNDIGAGTPYLAPDGLSVYFSVLDADGDTQIWMGSRPSMDAPFGEFEPLDNINKPGLKTHSPCISPDGKTLYFFQGDPDDLEYRGIFVSYWLQTPFQGAVSQLDQARQMKQQAAELIREASQKETHALEVLSELPPEQLPQYLTAKQLHAAKIKIAQALQRQDIVMDKLNNALEYLDQAMMILLPIPRDIPPTSRVHKNARAGEDTQVARHRPR